MLYTATKAQRQKKSRIKYKKFFFVGFA